MVVGNVSSISKKSSDLTTEGALSVDEKRTVTYTLTGAVDIANGSAADLNGMGLTITDTLNSKTHIEPGSEIQVYLKAADGTDLGSTTLKSKGGVLSSDILNSDGEPIGHLTLTKSGDTYTYRFTDLQGKALTGFNITITYKAYVGEIGGDSTSEVYNGEKIASSATISCDGDVRAFRKYEVYSNVSTDTFDIFKLKSTGLFMGSQFTGTYDLKSVKLTGDYTGTPRVWVASGERGSISTDLTVSDVTYANGVPVSLSGAAFRECSIAADGTVTLPQDISADELAAVFVKGSLPAGEKQFGFTITIKPSGNAAGDYYYNRATSSDGVPTQDKIPVIAPKVVAVVIQRDLSGMVWADLNNNGIRGAGENGVAGIKVELYKKNDSGKYELYSNGTNLNCLGRPITSLTTGADGMYCFEALPAGDYRVCFGYIQSYGVSPQNTGEDDTVDSDAWAYYSSNGDWLRPKTCSAAYIDDISLKRIDDFAADDYFEQSTNNDLGLVRYSLSALKLDLYNDDLLSGAAFKLQVNKTRGNWENVAYWKMADWTKADNMTAADSTDNNLEYSGEDGVAQWYGLSPGKYKVTEASAPDGYYKSPVSATVLINADGTYQITVTDRVVSKNRCDTQKGTLSGTQDIGFKVYNDRGYELPESGGLGVYPFVIGGLLLMAAPLIYIYVRRKERRSEN